MRGLAGITLVVGILGGPVRGADLAGNLRRDLLAPRHEGRDRVFALDLGPEGHRILEAWLGDDEPRLRAASARALGRIWEEVPAWTGEVRPGDDPAERDPEGRARAVARLVAAVGEEADERVLRAQVWALARIGEPARGALEDAHEAGGVPAGVMDAYRRARVLPALAATLHYGHTEGFYEGRYDAVQALGPAVVPLLSEIVQNPRVHFEIRDAAVTVLGVIADPASAGVLESMLMPVGLELQQIPGPAILDPRLREHFIRLRLSESARRALVRLGRPGALRERLRALLERLERTADDEKTGLYWQVAYDYQKLGETEKAKAYYRLQIEHAGPGPSSRRNIAHYNLACLAAKEGDVEEALSELDAAVRAGFTDRDWMSRDGDLQALHGLGAFEAILDRIGEVDEEPSPPEDS